MPLNKDTETKPINLMSSVKLNVNPNLIKQLILYLFLKKVLCLFYQSKIYNDPSVTNIFISYLLYFEYSMKLIFFCGKLLRNFVD